MKKETIARKFYGLHLVEQKLYQILKSYSIFILILSMLISCNYARRTPTDFVNITIGTINRELGESGYYIKTNGEFQVIQDSSLQEYNAFRFFRKGDEYRCFGVITIGDKQLNLSSDPYLSEVSPFKITQSSVFGKTRNWEIYDTRVMGYYGILEGEVSCMVSAPEIKSLDTLIAIASSITKH